MPDGTTKGVRIYWRSHKEAGRYWIGVDPKSIGATGDEEIVLYAENEKHFFVFPSEWLAREFTNNGIPLSKSSQFTFNVKWRDFYIEEFSRDIREFSRLNP